MKTEDKERIILPIVKEHGRAISNINATFIAIFDAGWEACKKHMQEQENKHIRNVIDAMGDTSPMESDY